MFALRPFRLSLTVLTVLAMMLGSGFGASAMCGLTGQDVAAQEVSTTHAGHGQMSAADMEPAPTTSMNGQMSCDMCVGDGGCDHGVCTPGITVPVMSDSTRAAGDHYRAWLSRMVSHDLSHQPPPPRHIS